MSPRIAAIENLLETRAKRDKRVAVLYGAAIAFLVAAVLYVVYSDYQQDQQLRSVSVCATEPRSPECARGHANSVALTTPAEACYILAQGGIRCRKPLPDASVYKRRLDATVNRLTNFQFDAVPDDQTADRAPTPNDPPSPPEQRPDSDEPERPSVPRPPRAPNPSTPTEPSTPEPRPEPPTPTPSGTRPLVDLPDQLGVCVNALGISVAC